MTLAFIQSILSHDWYTLGVKLGYQALAWIIVLLACLVDLKTGIAASRKTGISGTSSTGLRQTLKKYKEYMDIMIIAFATDVFLSIFNTMADSYSILAIFSLPLVTIGFFIYTMATEVISILENKRKAAGSPIYTPQAINAINEITKALGIDGIERLSEMIKNNTKECPDGKQDNTTGEQ